MQTKRRDKGQAFPSRAGLALGQIRSGPHCAQGCVRVSRFWMHWMDRFKRFGLGPLFQRSTSSSGAARTIQAPVARVRLRTFHGGPRHNLWLGSAATAVPPKPARVGRRVEGVFFQRGEEAAVNVRSPQTGWPKYVRKHAPIFCTSPLLRRRMTGLMLKVRVQQLTSHVRADRNVRLPPPDHTRGQEKSVRCTPN